MIYIHHDCAINEIIHIFGGLVNVRIHTICRKPVSMCNIM